MNRISIKLKVSLWYTLIIAVISAITLFAMISVSEKLLINDATNKIVRLVDSFANPSMENRENHPKEIGRAHV